MPTLTEDALQALLQLTGAGFPTGAFSHSCGPETVVQANRMRDAATFGEWLDVHLDWSAAPTDGAGAAGLAATAVAPDIAALRHARLYSRLCIS